MVEANPKKSSGNESSLKCDDDMDAKLSQIDSDIQAVYLQALKNGKLTRSQIFKAAEPLLKYAGKQQKRTRLKVVWIGAALIVCLTAALLFHEPSYRIMCVCTRLLFIKVLPYWDWTLYYNEECLIPNPYYQSDEDEILEKDCEVCGKMDKIERVANISQSVMSDEYLKRDTPVIVTDAVDEWPAKRQFNIKFLHQLYNNEELLKKTPPCFFSSSIYRQSLNLRQLFAMVLSREVTHWYAHWENCEKSTVRLMRRFYRRPYFIPAMVESIDRNWMLLSSDYDTKHYQPVDISSPMMWMAQLQGQNKIRLVPRHPCNETCSSLYAVLHEGETVVWTDFLWTLEYLPLANSNVFNAALASGGSFD